MNLNAIFHRKENDFEERPCVIEKIIELDAEEFAHFRHNMLDEKDFISQNSNLMHQDKNGVYHCLLVLGKGDNDGILIESEGADYARYSAFIPNARQVLFMEQRYNCIGDLESSLMDAADEITSCANVYVGEGPYRVLIEDITSEHGFDEQYIPLLLEMLNEHRSIGQCEVIDDEIMVYGRQEQAQLDPMPPNRTEHLLREAMWWIGESEKGKDFYDALKNDIGMTNDEMVALGYENLKGYFESSDEDESFTQQM